MSDQNVYDVAILGGGLAGLTLTRQLLQQAPETRILVLERRSFPVPEGAYKVGESTVEIGAHYLGQQLRLKKHLVDDQLPKFGLRFFFNDPCGCTSLADGVEVGASEFFAAPGYQVDRGRLENYLAKTVAEQGAEFRSEVQVTEIHLADDGPHEVRCRVGGSGGPDANANGNGNVENGNVESGNGSVRDGRGESRTVRARWLIDASGRAGLLKRKLDLAQPIDHNVNAAWFRIGAELHIDDWCDDPQWRLRTGKVPRRWLSTNHLLGKGYWVWIIPLASGATSVGIVADPRFHPLSEINQFDRAMEWLAKHEPLLAEVLQPHRDRLQDFSAIKRLGYSCKQVFSEHRWALTGEAGVFLDPLYSPGIDYIAIANTMICGLIDSDRRGEPLDQLAPRLQSTFFTLFQNNLLSYQDQYALFGNPRVMSLKYVWDYAIYWSFPALLYFNERLADAGFIQSLGKGIQEIRDLNVRMQQFLLEWEAADSRGRGDAVFVDQHDIAILTQLNAELRERLAPDELRERFARNVGILRELFAEITSRVTRWQPDLRLESAPAPGPSRLENVFAALDL